MKIKYHLFVITLLCLTLSACKKHGEKPAGNGVYIAGYLIAANDNGVATYWKDGVAYKLMADSSRISVANAIAVAGGNIYVAGYAMNDNGDMRAMLWKNGVPTQLSNDDSEARAIAVSGQDVYVAGVDGAQGVYWKNDVLHSLSVPGDANAITVSGSDIYIAGASYSAPLGGFVMTYWKNGSPTFIGLGNSPNNSGGGDVSAILVNGSDVYLAGYEFNGNYWKNGTDTQLPEGAQSYPTGVALGGSDVYVSGYVQVNGNYQAAYWKNGQTTQLSTDASFANAIAASGSDIYIVGNVGSSAVYWKNGQQSVLSQHGIARAICIVNQ